MAKRFAFLSLVLSLITALTLPNSIAAEPKKIAIAYDVGGRGDNGLNDIAALGLERAIKKLNISSPRWNLLTGKKSDIYRLGEKSYMVTAQEDANEVGGFVHSGAFILVDQDRHVRGIYDGTKEEDVNHLMEDIGLLLKE